MYKAGVTSPKISVEQDQHKPWRYRPTIHLGLPGPSYDYDGEDGGLPANDDDDGIWHRDGG